MILAIISFLFAFVIAFGRQSAVFGKIEQSLWFFPNYSKKRNWFSLISAVFGLLSLYFYSESLTILLLLIIAALLILISYIFEFKYIFPEVERVERKIGVGIGVNPDTKVIGVDFNDLAVAYPLDVVIPRHIINDTIGGNNIVVSYCAICISGLIFNAEIDGIKMYLIVSGVWRRNMVMEDLQSRSLWQQATGECIYGKYKGRSLELLSGENTNWEAWLSKYPNSEYAAKCIEARKGYFTRSGMSKSLDFITPKITPPGFTDLQGLPTRETVFGITYNGVSKAYPKSEIHNLTTFKDDFNDVQLHLSYDKSSDYLTGIDDNNVHIIVEKHWWLGWKEFHPETEIWKNNT